MNAPTFKTREIAQLYEELCGWCHPEYPFRDPSYSPNSKMPAVDLTVIIAAWLRAGQTEPVVELLGFLTGSHSASEDALRQLLEARLPAWVSKFDEPEEDDVEADTPAKLRGETGGQNERDARRSLEKAMSPRGIVESAVEKLKVVPPMVRLVVHDYLTRTWGQGALNFSLGCEQVADNVSHVKAELKLRW